jgi:hypothetical protein
MLPIDGKETGGVTSSERYLAGLCERSFLSLWSHPNLFRARAKELCDLLVVFGTDIIIFSDKSCTLNASNPHGWARWHRSAILDSAHQLHRAEQWLRTQRHRVFLDPACEKPFPFAIPENPRFHLVAVASGAAAACRSHYGGSGSLVLAPSSNGAEPFTVGDINPGKTFVHVFDETSLDLIVRELDTTWDFLHYLKAKERFVRSGKLLCVAGEEHLLAYYLQKTDAVSGEHDFVVPPDATDVGIDEIWPDFARSREYATKKRANEVSYLWDRIIEDLAGHAARGTLVAGQEHSLAEHEEMLRALAIERRTARRGLSQALLGVRAKSDDHALFARTMPPVVPGHHAYVFMTVRREPELKTEEQYRAFRQAALRAYCEVAKLRRPTISKIVGLAFGTRSDPDGSMDSVVWEFDDWTDEDISNAEDTRRLWKWSDGCDLPTWNLVVHEYPDEPPAARNEVALRQASSRNSSRRRGRDRKGKRRAQRIARKKSRGR